MSEPRMRASYIQQNLASLAHLGKDAEARVRTLAGEEVVARIVAATRVDWLPLEVDVRLTDAVFRVVGEDGVRAWSRDVIKASVETPLFRPLVGAAVSLFGLTPWSLLRYAPQAWKQIYDGCGVLVAEQAEPTRATLRVEGAVPAMASSSPYVSGTCGTFEGVIEIARSKGRVIALTSGSTIEFEITWT